MKADTGKLDIMQSYINYLRNHVYVRLLEYNSSVQVTFNAWKGKYYLTLFEVNYLQENIAEGASIQRGWVLISFCVEVIG